MFHLAVGSALVDPTIADLVTTLTSLGIGWVIGMAALIFMAFYFYRKARH